MNVIVISSEYELKAILKEVNYLALHENMCGVQTWITKTKEKICIAYMGSRRLGATLGTLHLINSFPINNVVIIGTAGSINHSRLVGRICIPHIVNPIEVSPLTRLGNDISNAPCIVMEGLRIRLLEAKPSMDLTLKIEQWLAQNNIIYEKTRNCSSECFFRQSDEIDHNILKGDEIVEMSDFPIGSVCNIGNIPWISIRGITDYANVEGSENYKKNVEKVIVKIFEIGYTFASTL